MASWDRIRGVGTGEDQPYTAGGPASPRALLRGAALAAELLENACAPGPGDPPRLEVLRTLARDLKEELAALTVLEDVETGALEGALRAADVANLAACTVPELPEAAAATHLAAGASRALHALVEAGERGTPPAGGDHEASYALKDARGAAWRARLASRQVDELLGVGG